MGETKAVSTAGVVKTAAGLLRNVLTQAAGGWRGAARPSTESRVRSRSPNMRALPPVRAAKVRSQWCMVAGSRRPFRMSEIVGAAATKYFGDRLLNDTLIPISIVVTQLSHQQPSREIKMRVLRA